MIAKFLNFKQREEIRRKAGNLKDTHYGIGEQFPKEVNQRRKSLLPIMRKAREDGKYADLVADKLFIDGHLYREQSD